VATAKTESGKPLRTIFINPNLRTEFLKIAAPNTQRNLETCGILCGTLISNAFFISKLVIPEQESTSDTCDTVNESALFDYVDTNDLMTLGWIHTHPTQTCFMSSRDLHTHSGYQVQMAESIAIVCAPKHEPSYGVFRLTDPPGLKTILNCRQSGLFHPHGEGQIYTDATRPGHVQELPGLGFEVVDMRPPEQGK
jgi:STAM-binding protein